MKIEQIKKVSIVYVTLLSIIVCGIIFLQIGEVISKVNVFLLSVLVINLLITFSNLSYLFKKTPDVSAKSILVFNILYSILSGLNLRFNGLIVSNNLGLDFSVFLTKNQAGIDYGYHYNIFSLAIRLLFYDSAELSGYSIQVNLIMIAICIGLILIYRKEPEAYKI